ncbi:MAG: hypothetical protein H0U46_11565 [Actinobacteria bacterium]|nr:hypothetical protein [Actinomycetota bacterium]
MDVREVAPGLWLWSAYHEEWKESVGCVFYQASDGVVLIDPLVPADDAEHFWRALDRDVKRAGDVHVLITVFWHVRSTREVVDRYTARLWAPTRARQAIERRAGTVTDAYRPDDELPGGVRAYRTGRAAEVVFWIDEHRALVAGDVLLGDGEGGLRTCPESWLPDSVDHPKLAESLRPLLDLPVERVLVSHGEPVLADGRAALAAALGVK